MTKKKIKELIAEAACGLKVVCIYMVYNENPYRLIPLKTSDRLFLAIFEDDFIFDGFRISRFRDAEHMWNKNDKEDEIIRSEGLFYNFQVPEINVENWQAVFEGLQGIGKNILVEHQTLDGEGDYVIVGKVERVCKKWVYMRHVNANGIWEPEPYLVPYTEVNAVRFNSRYVDIFSKYIPEAPDATDRSSL